MHARGWLEPFFEWHNDDHHHSALALFTPAQVFFGRVPAVHAVQQRTLDAAYALHPHRFPNGPPKAALPPAEVHINPLEALAISIVQADHADTPALASTNPGPVDDAGSTGHMARPAPGAVLAVEPPTRARGARSVTGAEAPTLH